MVHGLFMGGGGCEIGPRRLQRDSKRLGALRFVQDDSKVTSY